MAFDRLTKDLRSIHFSKDSRGGSDQAGVSWHSRDEMPSATHFRVEREEATSHVIEIPARGFVPVSAFDGAFRFETS